ncbi:MAG TPA: hypothetical protein VKA46_10430 [Gemmataceae bacterium]|nr:hypothetical protein [Gemmataceae bacterium]
MGLTSVTLDKTGSESFQVTESGDPGLAASADLGAGATATGSYALSRSGSDTFTVHASALTPASSSGSGPSLPTLASGFTFARLAVSKTGAESYHLDEKDTQASADGSATDSFTLADDGSESSPRTSTPAA